MSLPETNEILHTGLGGSKPYLGRPTVVRSILKEYFLDVIAVRTAQVQKGEDPLPRLRELASHLQRVFYGQDDRYQASAWNAPASLGHYLVLGCNMGGDDADAVERLGLRIARDLLRDVVANEDENLSDEALQSEVDRTLALYTALLAGAPAPGGTQ